MEKNMLCGLTKHVLPHGALHESVKYQSSVSLGLLLSGDSLSLNLVLSGLLCLNRVSLLLEIAGGVMIKELVIIIKATFAHAS